MAKRNIGKNKGQEKSGKDLADHDFTKEDMIAPYGRCEKCNCPLAHEMDGADADGNRGRIITYCMNEECSEFAG